MAPLKILLYFHQQVTLSSSHWSISAALAVGTGHNLEVDGENIKGMGKGVVRLGELHI